MSKNEIKKAKREVKRHIKRAYENLQHLKPWYIPQALWDKIIDAVMTSL